MPPPSMQQELLAEMATWLLQLLLLVLPRAARSVSGLHLSLMQLRPMKASGNDLAVSGV